MNPELEKGRQHSQRGEFAEAAEQYRRLLENDPSRADVWYLKGLAEHQAGQLEAALRSAEKAIEAGGEHPGYLLLQGHVLQDRGEFALAEERFCRLASIRPDWAPGHIAIGAVRMDRGAVSGAAEAFLAAVSIDPRHPRAWHNLGVAWRALGRLDEATEAYERAIAIDPTYALAHLNLARITKSRDLAKSLAHAEAAARLDPRLIDAWLLAAEIHRRRSDPDSVLRTLGAALTHAPNDPRILFLRAELLADLGRIDDSRGDFTSIWQRDPSSLKAALGSHLLLPRIYDSLEHLDATRKTYTEGLDALHDIADRFHRPSPEDTLAEACWVNFHLAYQGRDDRRPQERYASLVRRVLEPRLAPFFESRSRHPGRDRLRIGFLSHHFFNSVVGRYFGPWITNLDRSRFESFVYYSNEWVADDTRTIASKSDVFRHVAGRPLLSVAQQVIADDLDILIYPELGMHAETFALANLRLAPVQCAAWGHPVTTGIPAIDWFISCEGMEPEGGQSHYCERLATLPGIGTRYALPRPDEGWTRADFGIPEGATAYLVPQSLFKIHPENDELLAEVLARDPAGIAVMFASRHELLTQAFTRRLAASLRRHRVDITQRVFFLGFMPHARYLRLNELCDVMLDTVHWSGGNTSLDAVASGLPIVTLPGDFMRGRQSASMMRELGLEQLIASTREAYVETALRLGEDREERRAIREHLAHRRGALFERDEPIRAFERFLVRIAEDH